MKCYLPCLFFAAALVLFSCENDSPGVPTIQGTVKGQIRMVDCYGYNAEDLSGVQVTISSDAFSADTTTDDNGNFLFDNVPFGRYQFSCKKENFIQQTGHATIGHTGGEVATTASERLIGIPDFGYVIDSVKPNNCLVNCYLKLNEPSKTFAGISFLVLLYFNDTPEVDSSHYDAYYIDYGFFPEGNGWKWYFSMCYNNLSSSFTSDSIYCRMYPIPFCYNLSDEEYLALPKGKPSNVFGFKRQ